MLLVHPFNDPEYFASNGGLNLKVGYIGTQKPATYSDFLGFLVDYFLPLRPCFPIKETDSLDTDLSPEQPELI